MEKLKIDENCQFNLTLMKNCNISNPSTDDCIDCIIKTHNAYPLPSIHEIEMKQLEDKLKELSAIKQGVN